MNKKKTIADYRKEVRELKKELKLTEDSHKLMKVDFVITGADLTSALNKAKDLEHHLELARGERDEIMKGRGQILTSHREQVVKQGAGIEILKSALCFCISGEPNVT